LKKISSNLAGSELQAYKDEFERKYFEEFDNFLAKYSKSPTWLSNDQIAKEVINSIYYYNKKTYKLFAYCIMPNHVHIILQPLNKRGEEFHSLSKIMYSLKRYTATSCNKSLKRKGQFWHHENYNHFIREEKDLAYQLNYIKQNPIEAGLVDKAHRWKYTWTDETYDSDFD